MIVDLPNTTTNAISHRLVDMRSGGAVALSRVLTLVVVSDEADIDAAIAIANGASHEHPCRVLAIAIGNRRGTNRLDAQIRIGGDAGASEVIVLRLYGPLASHGDSLIVPLLLPDAPIVVWWPTDAPDVPAQDAIGRMAQRRITDSGGARQPIRALQQLASTSRPGDTDLAWSRLTRWRALLAAALDQPPYEPVNRAIVSGASDSPSAELLAAWLALALDCPVSRKRTAPGSGITGVTLVRDSGRLVLDRPDGNVATLSQPGQPDQRDRDGPPQRRRLPDRGAAPARPRRTVRRRTHQRPGAAAPGQEDGSPGRERRRSEPENRVRARGEERAVSDAGANQKTECGLAARNEP